MLYDAELDHGGHPVLTWMAGNCAIWIDRNGNFKPDKAKSSEKIDGMTALVMARGLSMRSDGPSVYTQRGIRTI
jgi:phage terminase large subunit-like protein